MKNIIYFDASDAQKFDFDRFKKSINSYAKVSDDEIKAALKDLDNYEKYFGSKFERLRRITGYLVGTLDRWNDGKKAEEKARVKHSVNSSIDDATRAARLEQQAVAHNIAYACA